jgi:hypothetical protein
LRDKHRSRRNQFAHCAQWVLGKTGQGHVVGRGGPSHAPLP